MDVGDARYRFGALERIGAEAIGVPGKRTFRLNLESGAATARLWLEKEQLSQLAIHIHEIITSLSTDVRARSSESPEPQWDGAITSLDFKVGTLVLGRDSSSNCFLLIGHDVEEAEGAPATLSFWLTMSEGEELAKEALKVCAAGRPPCQLCGQPINPEGHMCPRSNGHGPLQA